MQHTYGHNLKQILIGSIMSVPLVLFFVSSKLLSVFCSGALMEIIKLKIAYDLFLE